MIKSVWKMLMSTMRNICSIVKNFSSEEPLLLKHLQPASLLITSVRSTLYSTKLLFAFPSCLYPDLTPWNCNRPPCKMFSTTGRRRCEEWGGNPTTISSFSWQKFITCIENWGALFCAKRMVRDSASHAQWNASNKALTLLLSYNLYYGHVQ